MPPYSLPLAGGALALLLMWVLYRRVFLWRRYAKRRASAARHHHHNEVIDWGRRQMAVGAADVDCLHDMAVALDKTGDREEAFGYALQVQQKLAIEHTGLVPQHPEDFGDPTAFHNASPHYLRSMRVLGHVYLERGQAEPAREIFEYLVGLGRRYVECNVDLAEACLRMDDAAAAVAALRRLLAADPVTGTKRVRADFDRLLAFAPSSPGMQTFRAEFLAVEGRTASELDRLLEQFREGRASAQDLLLAVELARKGQRLPALGEALDAGGARLAERAELRDALDTAARASGALRLALGLRELELDACFSTGDESVLPAVGDVIEALVRESAGDLELQREAAVLLARTGRVEEACRLAGVSLAPGDGDATPAGPATLLRDAAHRQRLVEVPRLLAGRAEPYAPVRAGEGGRVILVRPSRRYREVLNGAEVSREDRRQYAYELSSAILATGEARQHLTRLLQEVAASDGSWREPAALRLVRLFAEEDDFVTAEEYMQRVTDLAAAAAVARADVLDDAYALATLLEPRDQAGALDLYRRIALVDVAYRDVRDRRNALQAGSGPQRSAAWADTEQTDRPGLPATQMGFGSAGGELPEDDMDDLLAGFGDASAGGLGGGSESGLPASGDLLDDRYRIEDTLGEGGMGAVYQAFDTRLERAVAVKVIRPGLSDEILRAGERFTLEARLAGKLFQHPGVVTVLDLGDGPPPYIVMEYVQGDSLRDLLLERELSPNEAATVLYQTADTLAYAHAEGIIHRDLKPANIMVEPMPLRIRVADFGLAKLMDAGNRLTMSGAIVGTRLYMSPEQVQGHDLDGRADIYAWGCLAYELVAGQPPFTQGELSYQHVYAKPPALTDQPRAAEFPPAFLELVMQCLAKTPDERPADFEHIKADLRGQFAHLAAV